MSGKEEITFSFETKREWNLRALKRLYPQVDTILCSASAVTLYRFLIEDNTWEKLECEGTLFVVKLQGPFHWVITLNKQNPANHVLQLTTDCRLEVSDTFLMVSTGDGDIFGYWFYDAIEQSVASEVMQERCVAPQTHMQMQPQQQQPHGFPAALSALFPQQQQQQQQIPSRQLPQPQMQQQQMIDREELRRTLVSLIQQDDAFFEHIAAAYVSRSASL